MVAEKVQFRDASEGFHVSVSSGDANFTAVNVQSQLTVLAGSLSAPSDVEEDSAFTLAGWAAFAEDWESDEDSVFDDLLVDGDLQQG